MIIIMGKEMLTPIYVLCVASDKNLAERVSLIS